jgi:hypothetical protein
MNGTTTKKFTHTHTHHTRLNTTLYKTTHLPTRMMNDIEKKKIKITTRTSMLIKTYTHTYHVDSGTQQRKKRLMKKKNKLNIQQKSTRHHMERKNFSL